MNWLIEDFHADNRFADLAEAAKRQGHKVVVKKHVPFDAGEHYDFPAHSCTLFQGSIQMAHQLMSTRHPVPFTWVPGVWCNWNQMRCQHYYTKCGADLVNQGYMMMPLAEVARRREELFEHFGGCFFMRPDSGAKSFTGTLIHFDDFNAEARDFSQWRWIMNEASAEDLVVVAPPRALRREWRIAVTRTKAITGSLYKQDGQLKVEAGCPQEALELAEQVAVKFQSEDRKSVV
jgi:hypothetical protein